MSFSALRETVKEMKTEISEAADEAERFLAAVEAVDGVNQSASSRQRATLGRGITALPDSEGFKLGAGVKPFQSRAERAIENHARLLEGLPDAFARSFAAVTGSSAPGAGGGGILGGGGGVLGSTGGVSKASLPPGGSTGLRPPFDPSRESYFTYVLNNRATANTGYRTRFLGVTGGGGVTQGDSLIADQIRGLRDDLRSGSSVFDLLTRGSR